MTRIALAFMLTLALQTVSADVLLIEEVRQAGRMELPQNGQSKADIEAKFGTPDQKYQRWVILRFQTGSMVNTASTSSMTWYCSPYYTRVR